MLAAAVFGVTVAAAWLAALRVAWRWVGGGAARPVTAFALLAATAAAVPVLCGLSGLGTSPAAFALVTLALAGAAAHLAGPPGERLLPPSPRPHPAAAAAAGGALAATAHAFSAPGLSTDPFHLVEAVRWLHEGHPGTVELVALGFPAGNYPLVNELVLTWGLGLSRGFGPVVLWTAALTALLAGSLFAALRARVPAWAATAGALAAVAFVLAADGTDGSGTDLPSVAWLGALAALATAPDPRDRHLGPAALCAGLAIGTKTSVTVAALGLLLPAVVAAARERRVRAPDAVAVAAGLLAAGAWPVRNLLEHGSPLWPFSDLLGGDPVPGLIGELQTPFLADPIDAVRLYWGVEPGLVLRIALLLVAMAVAAALVRRRDVRYLAALAALGALTWAVSPLTGPSGGMISGWFLRYAMPVYLLAIAVLAITARTSRAAAGVLAAVTVSALAALVADTPWRMAAAVAGAAAGALLLRRVTPRPAAVAAVAALLVLAAPLVAGPRYARAPDEPRFARLLDWLERQPGYTGTQAPVVTTSDPDPRLAGEHLDHPPELVRPEAGCEALRRRARAAWLVLLRPAEREEACFRGTPAAYDDGAFVVHSGLARRG